MDALDVPVLKGHGMPESDLTWLSLLVFLPAAFAVGLLAFPSKWPEAMRWWALFGTAGTLSVGLCVVVGYYNLLDSHLDANGMPRLLRPHPPRHPRRQGRQRRGAARPEGARSRDDWVARRPWIAPFDIEYALGVDGISLPLVVLTALVTLLAVVASWKIDQSVRGYLALLLLLETGVIGAFLALDFFLFYVFYEVMLLPMYFLIGLWGGGGGKYAALKFVIYTLLGGVVPAGRDDRPLLGGRPRLRGSGRGRAARRSTSQKSNPQLTAPKTPPRSVEVHTFDFVTLAKVGRAVMLVLSGQEDRLAVKTQVSEEPGKGDDANAR